jgi:hypothetical protein
MIDSEIWQLLNGVSRSFYLSVRFLPNRVRPAIALGYLLSRASDTIADANSLAGADRLKILSQLRAQLFAVDPSLQRGLTECAEKQPEGAERQLLERVEDILACARQLPQRDQDLLLEVLGRIMRGQILDIERFELASSLRALRSPEELEDTVRATQEGAVDQAVACGVQFRNEAVGAISNREIAFIACLISAGGHREIGRLSEARDVSIAVAVQLKHAGIGMGQLFPTARGAATSLGVLVHAQAGIVRDDIAIGSRCLQAGHSWRYLRQSARGCCAGRS